jgi:DNA-binding NtrC family response regulator
MLNVVSVVLPPLRERREDIARLAPHFVEKYAGRTSRRVTACSPEALDCLRAYDWPGNVRELENAMERAVVMGSTSAIRPEDLPGDITDASAEVASSEAKFHERLRDMKRELVVKALEETQSSYVEAAKRLGLHPNNLHRLVKNLGIKTSSRK